MLKIQLKFNSVLSQCDLNDEYFVKLFLSLMKVYHINICFTRIIQLFLPNLIIQRAKNEKKSEEPKYINTHLLLYLEY